MFGQPRAPKATPFPAAAPKAVTSPISANFHGLAARSLAGRGGRTASPGAPVAGAMIPAPRMQETAAPHQRMPPAGMAL